MAAGGGQASGPRLGQRRHLGVGLSFPVRPVAGRLQYVAYEDDVEQAIGLILETARRERVMLPEFGSELGQMVFGPNSPLVQRTVENMVRAALTDWEPRVSVEAVTARAGEDQKNLLLIEIDYVVRRTNTSFNRVFPFYLNQKV
jgi:uncharacterized protein